MIKPNVFVHTDNTTSAPFCACGKNLVRQALMPGVVLHNITDSCNEVNCTCQNNSRVVRKANAGETMMFYNAVEQSTHISAA